MDAYMIDANGLVTRAHENVQRKMRELMEAQEQLTIARLLSRVKSIQAMPEFPQADEATKVTRRYTKRREGYTKATTGRKNALLKWWLETRKNDDLSYEEVRSMIKNLANSNNNRFDWCKSLSDNTILSVYNYIKESMGQSNGN